MASSSRLCSDEELQKARDDLRKLLGRRNPVPNESQPPTTGEQQCNNKDENKGSKGKMKKKLIRLPPELVEFLINYKCMPFPKQAKLPAHAVENHKELFDDLSPAHSVAQVLARHYDDKIAILQDMMRREVETKGYFTYEATVDEAEDDTVSAMASQQGPRGGGRRRHRPGVMKRAQGVKKVN